MYLKYLVFIIFIFNLALPLYTQDQLIPITGVNDVEKVTIDKYVFETALNSADRTISFLQWAIGVFSGVITILFVIFKYRDEKSLEKNRGDLKESQDKIEKIRLELIEEESKMSRMLERLQKVSQDYESKISGIESKIAALEVKSDELDKKTDTMNEINRYFSIAYSALEKGNNEEAIEYYSKIIDAKPDTETLTVVLNNRGNALQRAGKSALALKDYQSAIDLKPGHPQAFNNRGIVYEQLGDFNSALSEYSKAIELKKDYGDAIYNRGNIYSILKKYEEAESDFNMLLQFEPDDIVTKYRIAELFIFTNRLNELNNWIPVLKQAKGTGGYKTLAEVFEVIGDILNGKDIEEVKMRIQKSIKQNGIAGWNFKDMKEWTSSENLKPKIKQELELLLKETEQN